MGFLDKAKAAAEQAAAKAKEGVDDVQAKRELGQAYGMLGKTAFELVESGQVSHPQLSPLAEKIRALQAKTNGTGVAQTADATTTEPYETGQPPAMPT